MPNFIVGDVENERPSVPIIGVIEIKKWKDGKIRVVRPMDANLALQMLEEARAQIVGRKKDESALFVPEGMKT